MPNNPNAEANLIKYKKGQSGNPKGRPKKMETVLREAFEEEHSIKLTKTQMQDLVKLILGKTKSELVELAKNEDLPFWISLIAKKAERDYNKGSIHVLDVLFDRVYGKPKEEQAITQSGAITIKFEPLGPKKD